MKKIVISAIAIAAVLAVGMTAFAASSAPGGNRIQSSYCSYIDANQDGICDNWDVNHKANQQYCTGNGYNNQSQDDASNNFCGNGRGRHHGGYCGRR